MKRFSSYISLIIVFAMILSCLPTMAFGAEVGDDVLNAYYKETCTIDGRVGEEPLKTAGLIDLGDVSVGSIWNTEYLILYLSDTNGKGIEIDFGSAKLTVGADGSVSGISGVSTMKNDVLEIKIPLESAKIDIAVFEQENACKISVDGSTVFDGVIRFSSAEFLTLPYSSFTLMDHTTGHMIATGDKIAFKATEGKAGRSYIICPNDDILSNHDGIGVLELNVDAKSVPEFYDAPVTAQLDANCARICDGVAVGVNYDVPNHIGFTFNLTKIKDIGLCLVFSTKNEKAVTLPIDKESGDAFNLRFEYDFTKKAVDVFVDTKLVGHVADLHADPLWGKATVNQITFNLWTNTMPSDLDVTFTDVLVGNYYELDVLDYLTYEDILGDNGSSSKVINDLVLHDEFECPYLTEAVGVTFESSDNDLINASTGKVTRPKEKAEKVTITARSGGKSKTFDFWVIGENELPYSYLVVKQDITPTTGKGVEHSDTSFTFDENNNSVVIDLSEKRTITSVRLADEDEICRLNAESVTLWVSDDNTTYTQIQDFKFLRSGKYTYLYDFEVKGRFFKAHYTHFDTKDSDFEGVLSKMITVGDDHVFGIDDSVRYSQVSLTVTNDGDRAIRNEATVVSLKELGVEGDKSAIRVLMGNEMLYHYVEGDDLYIRIPYLEVGGDMDLVVFYGAENAIDISNKEAVYEINYGTRETYHTKNIHRWLFKIPAGVEFPNGDVSEREVLISWSNTVIYGSYDGGRSWFNYGKVEAGLDMQLNGTADPLAGGFIFDDETGRIFYETHCYNGFNDSDMTKSDCINKVLYSDDGGKYWQMADVLEPDTIGTKTFSYMLSYSDGIKVSSYDGDGPGVDFVFPTGAQFNNNGAFCARVAYSSDGGFTWQYSQNLLIYGNAAAFEGGMSEAYILENDDGVLVLYSRCQFSSVDRFAMAYSYDFGVTWTTEKTKAAWEAKKDTAPTEISCLLSTVYATNTQPVMFKYDGTPVFLWGGNNALNAGSYIRNPLNIAVSYDGLETWENIQNLFSETPHETYLGTHYITNPSVQKVYGDELVTTFGRLVHKDSVTMNVQDFTKFTYLTKGAYDSFEAATPKYEGWISYKGTVALSDDRSTDGSFSMKANSNSTTSRSIPYLTDGTISLDIFVSGSSQFAIELQPAFSKEYGKYGLLGLVVDGSKLNCGGKVLDLKRGWNTININIGSSGAVSVNDGDAVTVTLNKDVGEYVCYVVLYADTAVYLDNFKVVSNVDAEIYLTADGRKRVSDMEKLIDSIGEIDMADADKIRAIRAEFDALSVSEQLMVENIRTLEAAEYAIDAMLNPHVHKLTYFEEEKATCEEEGVSAHWYCLKCKKSFADESGETELVDLTIERTDHTFEENTCTVCGETREDNADDTTSAVDDPIEEVTTKAAETESPKKKKGCKSSISEMGVVFVIVPALLSAAVSNRKKKHTDA